MRCRIEIEFPNEAPYFTQSQYIGTRPTSPSDKPYNGMRLVGQPLVYHITRHRFGSTWNNALQGFELGTAVAGVDALQLGHEGEGVAVRVEGARGGGGGGQGLKLISGTQPQGTGMFETENSLNIGFIYPLVSHATQY